MSAIFSNNEEILSEDCEIREITFFEQPEEITLFDFSQFSFESKKGIVMVVCLVKEKKDVSARESSIEIIEEEDYEEYEEDNEDEDWDDESSINYLDSKFSPLEALILEKFQISCQIESYSPCTIAVERLNDFYDFSWFVNGEFDLWDG